MTFGDVKDFYRAEMRKMDGRPEARRRTFIYMLESGIPEDNAAIFGDLVMRLVDEEEGLADAPPDLA